MTPQERSEFTDDDLEQFKNYAHAIPLVASVNSVMAKLQSLIARLEAAEAYLEQFGVVGEASVCRPAYDAWRKAAGK